MGKQWTFIYYEGETKEGQAYKLTVEARSIHEAFQKFHQLINRQVFLDEINESSKYCIKKQ